MILLGNFITLVYTAYGYADEQVYTDGWISTQTLQDVSAKDLFCQSTRLRQIPFTLRRELKGRGRLWGDGITVRTEIE